MTNLGSSGNGSDERARQVVLPADTSVSLSVEEANDLLNMLHTGAAQVQAILSFPEGPSSVLRGILRAPFDGRYWCVASDREITGSALSFDLLAAVSRRFGDEHSMPADATFPFRFHYKAALRFEFENGARLTLVELENEQKESSGEMAD
jgi:hypothetical protein